MPPASQAEVALRKSAQRAGCSGADPLLRWMELGYGRHGSDAIAPELSELLATSGVDVDEAVHVAYTETVNGVWGMTLPLSSKAESG